MPHLIKFTDDPETWEKYSNDSVGNFLTTISRFEDVNDDGKGEATEKYMWDIRYAVKEE